MAETQFSSMWNIFMRTCAVEDRNDKGEPIWIVKDQLGWDVITFILRQLNDETLKGTINEAQLHVMLEDASLDLCNLIYIKNYEAGKHLIEKDPLHTSAQNLLRILFTRVVGGKDRELLKLEIQAKQPISYVMQGGR